jgi:cellulose synthase operon protein C
MSYKRLPTLLLALAVGFGGIGLNPADADAQTRKEERKREILDYKAYEREQSREAYGELANQKRQEAIDQLKEILSTQRLPPDTKAEMYMRLAELYFEQSKYEYNLEMQDYDKRYEEWFNLDDAVQKKTEEPKIITTRSTAYAKKAIENYRNILQNYPSYPRIDEALFFLAFMLNDIGEEKDALDMYNKLVKTYPDSGFVPDAYNAIGEYYFNNNNAYKALQAYKRAAAYKDSKIYTFALYKMGWCYYNVGEFGTAIDTMKELVAETDRRIAAAGGQILGISLKEEALRDLVLFFSEEGDLEAAKEYFTRYGEKRYYRKMLRRLGDIYIDQGKNELAIQTYRELIADDPLASDNPSHQNEIVQAYWKRDQFDEANEEINKLVEIYGRESRWAQENKDNKSAVKESERLIEKNLRNVAIDSHQQALKRKSAKLLLLAEENYREYLIYFPDGHKSYEMRYWYAEVLYKLKKYDLSTDEYEAVVKADPKGKYLKDAAANAIFSIDEYLKPIKSRLDREADKKVRDLKRSEEGTARFAEVELHPWEQRLVDACDTYGKVLPDDDKTLKFLYKAALLLHDRNHFNDSNERFLQIVRAEPKSSMAEHGVHTILKSYEQIENWDGLNGAAREFYANEAIGKTTKFKGELKNIFQRATFKIAEGYAAEDKAPEAAKAFDAFYREFGDSDVRDIALYNASFYYGKAGDRGKQLELRHEFVENYPEPVGKDAKDAMLYEKSLSLLGEHYQSIAAFDKAAVFFRQLYDKDPAFNVENFTTAKDALYNSALFNEALGNTDQAVRDFRDYVKVEGVEGVDKIKTRLRIAHLLYNTGDLDGAGAEFKRIYSDKELQKVAFDQVMEAHAYYGRTLAKQGDVKGMRTHYAEAMRTFSGKEAALEPTAQARFWAAEMRFMLLEPGFDKYAEIQMPEDTKKAKGALEKKATRLSDLEKEYVRVLDLKQGEWGIAALFRIGTLYGGFADALRDAPCPKKLDEDQCLIYKFGLEDKAYPLIDKAVEAFTSTREKSYELGLYTEYTQFALDELSRLRPEEYPPGAEALPTPEYTSNPYSTVDFVE